MNKKTQKKYVALLTMLAMVFVQCFVQTLLRQTPKILGILQM